MLELADVVRAAGPAYVQAHAGRLSAAQRRALDDIAVCRTATLGGTIARCDQCGAVQYHYHSCRNRHCPKCQEDRAQDWLARTRERLLPCDHYLLTFTLPSELRALARRHPRIVYAALLRASAGAVQELAADPQWVGGTVGILAVRHTWSRTLEYPPHAHVLVTAGGLAADGITWRNPAHARFLMPGYALSPRFRGRMRAALRRAGLLDEIDPRIWRRRWTVHVQQIGSGQHASLYLSRYIYRVALTDDRLERFANGQVTFRYTHGRTGESRRLTLPTDRFLTQFLQHVLPRGFPKVRSYGLLSPSRTAQLERARQVLLLHAASVTTHGVDLAPLPPPSVDPPATASTHSVITLWLALTLAARCPVCHRGQQVLHPIPRTHSRGPP